MKALLVGCGPSGENWRDYCDDDTIVIAFNSAIVHLADRADYFLVVENLGHDIAQRFPWLMTETHPDCVKLISDKTCRKLGLEQHVIPGLVSNITRRMIPDDPDWTFATAALYTGPMCMPRFSVGTVLMQGIHWACQLPHVDEIHSIGCPLCWADRQHWTEEANPYKPGASFYLQDKVFIKVNDRDTIWQWAMSAAYLASIRDSLPKPWHDHSDGLLQIPNMADGMQYFNGHARNLRL